MSNHKQLEPLAQELGNCPAGDEGPLEIFSGRSDMIRFMFSKGPAAASWRKEDTAWRRGQQFLQFTFPLGSVGAVILPGGVGGVQEGMW